MSFFRLLKHHVLEVLVIFALVIIQANADMSLPNYMSDIVDTGIQQQGIASPVAESFREETLAALEKTVDANSAKTIDVAYGEADTNGTRNYIGTKADAEAGSSLAAIMQDAENKLLDVVLQQRAEQGDESAQAMLTSSSAFANSDTMAKERALAFVAQEYSAQNKDMSAIQNTYLVSMALKMFELCLVSLVSATLLGFMAARVAAAIARDLRESAFRKIMHFSAQEISEFSQASLITRSTNDIQQIQMATTLMLRMVLLAPVMAVVALMKVLAKDTGLNWTIAVAILAVGATIGVLMGLTLPKFKRMQSYIDRVNLVGREMLDGIMPIRAFGQQEHELERFDVASTDLMRTQLFTNRAMSFMMPLMMLIMNCITLLIVWFGGHRINDGVMQVGDLMAFILYTMQIVFAFMIFTMISVLLPRAQIAASRVFEIIDSKPSVTDPDKPIALAAAQAASGTKGAISFKDVSFKYPDAEGDVLTNISFEAAPGKMLGIIGSTGSGKSTLAQLLVRLFDVTQGSIEIDGQDIRNYSLEDLRNHIGFVPQQGRLFSGDIASNIGFANKADGSAWTKEELEQAAKISQSLDFINDKEEGFASEISQGGTNVSGGQRQRLSIARALIKRPDILVFDDAFSALDYATDARLREALIKEQDRATLVIVAQRIATIMRADHIVVLDEGQIVGQGTHEKLLKSCPEYLEIAKSQLSAKELGLVEEGVN